MSLLLPATSRKTIATLFTVLCTLVVAGTVHAGSIGDFIFLDVDGDGVQEAGDTGFPGIAIELQTCDGTTLDSTVSDANGAYGFAGLPAGSYQLRITVPGEYRLSPAGQDRWSIDSDFDPATGIAGCRALAVDDAKNGVDAGLVRRGVPQPGSAAFGDLVWEDVNGDGIQDVGESGFAGIVIELAQCDGTFITSTTTGPNGEYAFRNLDAASYQLRVIVPPTYRVSPIHGTHWSEDSDFAIDGIAYCKTLTEGQIRNSVDAGLIPDSTPRRGTARLGHLVWQDLDADGVYERGEPGIGGVTVSLQSCDGQTLRTQVSAADGEYEFNEVLEGQYQMQIDLPSGFALSPVSQPVPPDVDPGERLEGIVPGSWFLDSDFRPETRSTACISVGDGQLRNALNAGLYRQSQPQTPVISARPVTASESDAQVIFTVRLSTPVATPVTVKLATNSATATTGRDFFGLYRLLEFQPGVTSIDVPVSMRDDSIFEADEYFEMRIWDATNADVEQEYVRISVTEDDAPDGARSRLSVAPTTIREGEDDEAKLIVTLSPPSSQSVSVTVATGAGSAQGGADYFGSARLLEFVPGEEIKIVPITIIDDTETEATETFEARLIRPLGADSDIGRATISILDND